MTTEGSDARPLDHRGSRRLAPAEQLIWTLLAAVTYTVLSIWHKWLLNWILGPVWLVGWVVIGPIIADHVGRRFRR